MLKVFISLLEMNQIQIKCQSTYLRLGNFFRKQIESEFANIKLVLNNFCYYQSTVAQIAEPVAADSRVCGSNPAWFQWYVLQ